MLSIYTSMITIFPSQTGVGPEQQSPPDRPA